jgi:hypothetical protein
MKSFNAAGFHIHTPLKMIKEESENEERNRRVKKNYGRRGH